MSILFRLGVFSGSMYFHVSFPGCKDIFQPLRFQGLVFCIDTFWFRNPPQISREVQQDGYDVPKPGKWHKLVNLNWCMTSRTVHRSNPKKPRVTTCRVTTHANHGPQKTRKTPWTLNLAARSVARLMRVAKLPSILSRWYLKKLVQP